MLPYTTSQHSLLHNDKLIAKLQVTSGKRRGRFSCNPDEDSGVHLSFTRALHQSAASRNSNNDVETLLSGFNYHRGSFLLAETLTDLSLFPPSETDWKGRMEALRAETRVLGASFEKCNKQNMPSTASLCAAASKNKYVAPKRYSFRHIHTSQPINFSSGFFISSPYSSVECVKKAISGRVHWRYLEYISGSLIHKY
jgi:hypothetical protein